MTIWPDPERLLIARYLASLGLRSPNSRTYYKQALNSFQDVAERYAETRQGCAVGLAAGVVSGMGSDDAVAPHPHRRPVPRLSSGNRRDRTQSRRSPARCMQYQAVHAGLAGHWRHAIRTVHLPNCTSPDRSAACWAK
jgi:hypothetical protein